MAFSIQWSNQMGFCFYSKKITFSSSIPLYLFLFPIHRSTDDDLQQLWDFVNVIESCVGNWKKTAWKRLDVEEIEQQCKRFSKDIRSLGKLIRSWQPFIYIEKMLRNLVTSLRAITELQNTAIKDRHWLELMKSTGV